MHQNEILNVTWNKKFIRKTALNTVSQEMPFIYQLFTLEKIHNFCNHNDELNLTLNNLIPLFFCLSKFRKYIKRSIKQVIYSSTISLFFMLIFILLFYILKEYISKKRFDILEIYIFTTKKNRK